LKIIHYFNSIQYNFFYITSLKYGGE